VLCSGSIFLFTNNIIINIIVLMSSVAFPKRIVYYFMVNPALTHQPRLYPNGCCTHIVLLLLLLSRSLQGCILAFVWKLPFSTRSRSRRLLQSPPARLRRYIPNCKVWTGVRLCHPRPIFLWVHWDYPPSRAEVLWALASLRENNCWVIVITRHPSPHHHNIPHSNNHLTYWRPCDDDRKLGIKVANNVFGKAFRKRVSVRMWTYQAAITRSTFSRKYTR